jgi:hypothetical protein
MSDAWQTVIVIAVVLGAAVYLWSRSRRKSCGDGGCGCKAATPVAGKAADESSRR